MERDQEVGLVSNGLIEWTNIWIAWKWRKLKMQMIGSIELDRREKKLSWKQVKKKIIFSKQYTKKKKITTLVHKYYTQT